MANPEPSDEVIEFVRANDRQANLVDRYHQRQDLQQRSVPGPQRPDLEPADQRTWWGGRRESATVQRHNRQLAEAYLATERADYVRKATFALEYGAVREGIGLVAAEEAELMQTTPGSLAETIGQQLVLDSVERSRRAVTDIMEKHRETALGNQ